MHRQELSLRLQQKWDSYDVTPGSRSSTFSCSVSCAAAQHLRRKRQEINPTTRMARKASQGKPNESFIVVLWRPGVYEETLTAVTVFAWAGLVHANVLPPGGRLGMGKHGQCQTKVSPPNKKEGSWEDRFWAQNMRPFLASPSHFNAKNVGDDAAWPKTVSQSVTEKGHAKLRKNSFVGTLFYLVLC